MAGGRPPGRPNLGLSDKRSKRTFVLQLDDPQQKYADEAIERMKQAGKFQDWIRDLVVSALPIPATVKAPRTRPNGAHDEVYNEKVQEEA